MRNRWGSTRSAAALALVVWALPSGAGAEGKKDGDTTLSAHDSQRKLFVDAVGNLEEICPRGKSSSACPVYPEEFRQHLSVIVEDDVLLSAAVLGDMASIKRVASAAESALEAGKKPVRVFSGPNAVPFVSGATRLKTFGTVLGGRSAGTVKDEGEEVGSPLAALLAAPSFSPGVEVAEFGSRVTRLALEGLAKLIVDRAKLEAVGWLLDQVGEDLCGDGGPRTAAQAELAEQWFPSVCTLTGQGVMWRYGAGEAQLDALRSTILRDMARWPGVLAGLAVATQYWNDAAQDGSILACRPGTNADGEEIKPGEGLKTVCDRVQALRQATARPFDALVRGEPAVHRLYEWGAEVDRLNRRDGSGVTGGTAEFVVSPRLQLLACAASLPQVAREVAPALDGIPELDTSKRAQVQLLVGLVRAPACWTVVGQGYEWKTGAQSHWSLSGEPSGLVAAQQKPGADLERLSTLVRLRLTVGARGEELAHRLSVLEGAWRAYLAPSEPAVPPKPADPKPASDDPKPVPPARSVSPRLVAALDLGDATLGTARAVLGVMSALANTEVKPLPGLAAKGEKQNLAVHLAAADHSLSVFEHAQTTARALLLGPDAGALVDAVMGWTEWVVEREKEKAAAAKKAAEEAVATDKAAKKAAEEANTAAEDSITTLQRFARHLGVLGGIVRAQTADEMAAALDAAASPPGGWRLKGRKGAFVVSLSSFPGLFTAGELRWGQYGVHREHGSEPHWQRPTLTLPLGFDVAWGREKGPSPWGLFVSFLDPAAFLHYDTPEGSRLPGPSLVTAFAPGLGARMAFRDTPFSLMLLAVYRPGFRQWDPSLAGVGADVLQVGVSFGVDVTLWQINAAE